MAPLLRPLARPFQTALLALAVWMPLNLIASGERPAIAQEHQGCFLINTSRQVIDLSNICPNEGRTLTVEADPATAGAEPTLGTGDIQVTLRWTTSDDLDLAVTDPRGETAAFFNRQISSGGQLDVDANAACSEVSSSPIENVFWPTGGAPQGQYTITVNLFTRCGQTSGPIPFVVNLLVQGTRETFDGTVSDEQPSVTYSFSLPPR
ncbi:MAG: hypothetical protein KME20_18425 [Kaiparowitsia implicata GSE-PSE-MK54-09C]|nr:hypothetical protein [Kaiparowitsia implicata GSE-PSE-MK54-09C]